MITYKFTMGKKGQLTCYKSDNTLNKYTGKKALNKLNHIMDFSFHSFDSMVKQLDTNKYCKSMVFVSNNHVVTFEDINNFQRNADFSIEGVLKEILIIIKENQMKSAQLRETIMEQYKIDVRMTKLAFLSAFSAALIAINNLPKINLNQKDNNTAKNNIKEESGIIKVVDYIETPAANLVLAAEGGEITNVCAPKSTYSCVSYDENGVAYFEKNTSWNGKALTSKAGVVKNGPSGEDEMYYDADCISKAGMDNCVKYMRDLGYDEVNYPYYIREDGVRMFGNYVMVAANVDVLPKGTIIETSLGLAMVVDKCEGSSSNIKLVDIAVNWTKKKTLEK